MLLPNNGILNSASSGGYKKQKQLKVKFEMSTFETVKQQELPSHTKEGFRKLVDLGSGSTWTNFELSEFRVELRHNEPFPEEVLRYWPRNDEENKENELSEEEEKLKKLRTVARKLTYHDVETGGSVLGAKLGDSHPLYHTFGALNSLFVRLSQEAQQRERMRNNILKTPSKKQKQKPISDQVISSPLTGSSSDVLKPLKREKRQKSDTSTHPPVAESLPNVPEPRTPQTTTSTPETSGKRNLSNTSFGTLSTETTPKKLVAAEMDIQFLQGFLVREIITAVYGNTCVVPVPWTKGRKMELQFKPALDMNYFFCSLIDNDTTKSGQRLYDKVIALPDGALHLITTKRSSSGTCIWSKQHACMLFEAKRLDTTPQQMVNDSIKALENQKVAAQIFAEMLGLVCHKEFFVLDQMAFAMYLSGFHASFFWAKFSCEYLRTVRFKTYQELQDMKEPIILHRTKPKSLMDPDQRDDFLQEFFSIVRCLADGNGKIGFLRRDLKDNPIHRSSKSDTESDEELGSI